MQRHPTTTSGGVIAVKSYLFRIVLTKEDDGRWSAEVPALPGCATQGETFEEAQNMIQDAIEGYLLTLRDMKENLPSESAGMIVTKIPAMIPA